MAKISIYSKDGKVVGEQALDDAVFGVAVVPDLVKQVTVAEQTNARQGTAHTKTRGEVRGGGKKPWRQKGTGRARHGSIRSPLWRGGGITFGPRKTQNHSVAVTKKMRRKALLMSLSDKVANGQLVVMDALPLSGKTKDWRTATAAVWSAVNKDMVRTPSTLVMLPQLSDEVKRSTSNLKSVEAIRTDSLHLTSVLGHQYALTTVDGLKAIEAFLKKQ